MQIKKEHFKIKPDAKFYKRQAMAMVGMAPGTKIHRNKRKYNRGQNKKALRKAILEAF